MVSPNHTMAAINASLITPALIDERVTNLFKIRFRVGQFDPPGPLDKITNATTVCTPYALELARSGVSQSATLLKNDGGTLPLDAESLSSVADIGPMLGDQTTSKLSSYYGPTNATALLFRFTCCLQTWKCSSLFPNAVAIGWVQGRW